MAKGSVCPAPAGMSPLTPGQTGAGQRQRRLPRASGDEPLDSRRASATRIVCPAPAGMSPPGTGSVMTSVSLPRASGDEPREGRAEKRENESAPRQRG